MMSVKRRILIVLLSLGTTLLTSCASVMSLKEGELFKQKIEITTNPEDARVIKHGEIIGLTPFVLSADRKSNFALTFKKEGYKTKHIFINRKLNLWTLGNLPFTALVFPVSPIPLIPTMGSDILTGSFWKLNPDYIQITLEKVEQEKNLVTVSKPTKMVQQINDESISIYATGNKSWWIKTTHIAYENYHVVKLEGLNLFITDNSNSEEKIRMEDIHAIASEPELTLDQVIIWGGIGAYGGSAAGAFVGWPLFPAWGAGTAKGERHMKGLSAMMGLGAVAGAYYGYKWRLVRKGVSQINVSMHQWPIERKKEWIKSIMLKQ